ncbi:MAG: acylneuraminate cytidylyltransferase [Pseudobdellovibrio sp.]
MKAVLVSALLALSFTTGFTCSKNAPEAAAPAAPATEQAAAAAPAEGQAPAATEGQAPAATETK